MDPLQEQQIFDISEPRDKQQFQAFIGIGNYLSELLPNVASTAAILTDLQATTRTWGCTDIHLEAFDLCKELSNNVQVLKPWHNNSEEPKYLICNASNIGSGS